MRISVQACKTVKPAYDDGGVAIRDVVPLTVFDKVCDDMYVSVIYMFRPPMPSNAALEASLAKVLTQYREWAGQLAAGNCAILLNDHGVLFVEATAEVRLDSVLPVKPTPEVLSLHPSGDGAAELMLVQVTRFACGSVALGITTRHVVSDGRAHSNFFIAWSQATRGAAISPAPVHDRVSFFVPRDPPLVEFEHRGVEFKPKLSIPRQADEDVVVVHKVHFSREMISKLKSQVASPPGSTMRCVVAHLWRSVTVARGLEGPVATRASIAVDGRARMTPPVPGSYTGNLVLWARPVTTARELVSRPLQHAVELINRELARVNDDYFRSFIDFASSGAVEREGLVPTADATETVLSPNVEVDSWLGIPFCDVDFGGGRPFFFMPSYLPYEGLLILLPSSLGDGSIDAYASLFSRHVDAFKDCCYSLLPVQPCPC